MDHVPMLVSVMSLVVGVATQAVGQESVRLTLDRYLDLEEVSNPQLSPAGDRILYTRRWIDRMTDRWESALWQMTAGGERQRFLLKGSSPQWSPDGTRVAFMAPGAPHGVQIFVRWMDLGGAVSQVTRVTHAPGEMRWSPDGTRIAFTMFEPAVGTSADWTIALPRSPEGAKWTAPPRIIERLDYRQDRAGFTEPGYRHIFVVPADGGTPRQLTHGDFNHGSPRWMPDGRTIVLAGLRAPNAEYTFREGEVYALDVETREIRPLTSRDGMDANPVVSPDGRHITYLAYDRSDDPYLEPRLRVMRADGSGNRMLADLDRPMSGLTWSADGSGLYVNVADHGTQNVRFVSLDGAVRSVTSGVHMLTMTDAGSQGQAVGTVTSVHQPREIITFDLGNPELRQLTTANDDVFRGVQLGEIEEFWYPSFDGLRIQGWILKPPDFDPGKRYPLLLSIHGGPHGMYNVGFDYFGFTWQEFAANGYIVLFTNPRGSSGYGRVFANAIKHAFPGRDYDDLMLAVDTVIARGYVDDRNLFVEGGSGGGALTTWIVGHTDRFAAAAAICPVTNWLSFVGTTDGPFWYHTFQKRPWEDPSEFLRRSPLMYVGNVKTPTMLMTGEEDLRTPMSQSEEYYQALKMRRVPAALLRFHEEPHGMCTRDKPSNYMRSQLYMRRWFERHARPGMTEGGTSAERS